MGTDKKSEGLTTPSTDFLEKTPQKSQAAGGAGERQIFLVDCSSMPVGIMNQDSDDDWETDPDYVNNMSEEQQRWGGARDTGTLDMDKFREEIRQEDSQAGIKRQQEDGYKSSTGYGGKFGVQNDRVDKSALGWEHHEKVDKHESQKDYKTGFGGKFGVQTDRVDKSALGWEHHEKVDKHESQKDYKTGFGGQYGVQSDRVDKTAVGWDHNEKVDKHESQAKQADFKAGFAGHGERDDVVGPVGTNYVKTKPDIPARNASNLKSRFEGMAKQSETEAKQRAEEEKKRRDAKDLRDKEEQRRNEERRQADVEADNVKREGLRKAEEDKLDRELEQKRMKEEAEFRRRDEEERQNMNVARDREEKMEAEMRLREEKQVEEKRLREQEKKNMENKIKEEQDKQLEQQRKEEEKRRQEQAKRQKEEAKIQQEQARREEEERQNQATNARYDMPPEEDDIYDNIEEVIDAKKAGAGITAIALYDYQAMAEDEISFDPNDIISNIEMVDEGWWIGECHGRFGLFPANYVEVQQ